MKTPNCTWARLARAWMAPTSAVLLCMADMPAGAADEPMPASCWAASVAEPHTPDMLPNAHRSLAPLHRVLDVLEQMVRRNAGLAQLPEVRLRAGRAIGDAENPSSQPRDAALHVNAYGPKAWGRGPCEVIPQAERLGARAGISFFINSPLAPLQRWAHDEQLTTYLEGERGEPMQGWPVYRGCALLSADRRVWWLPVTVAEWLDFEAREQRRRLQAFDREQQPMLQPFDLAAAEAQAEALRPLNARAADAALHLARERKRREPQWQAEIRARRAALQAELDAVVAQRQTMSAVALAEPYRLGNGRFGLPSASQAGLPLKRLVKLDPSYPWESRRRTRVQAIHVCPSMLDRTPRYGVPMRAAVQALDFARIAALLD